MSQTLTLRLDDLSDSRIARFLQDHLQDMRRCSPSDSMHALDLNALRHPDIRFWTAWCGGQAQLVATGALKRIDGQHAEIKSMRTAAAWRGQGIARQLVVHLVCDARAQGFERLSLETGTHPYFAPAHALYAACGFEDCAPFGDYRPDPNSRFMTRAL